MLERVLVGCDVLPMAVHLTLSMLAAAYPEETFSDCSILSLEYGKRELGDFALGSLDLLKKQETESTLPTQPALMDVIEQKGTALGGSGEREVSLAKQVPHHGFDLVIMNPPFTRPNNKTIEFRPGVEFPAFAALETTQQDQLGMMKRFKQVTEGSVYHGQAGIASAFVALAEKKLRPNGTLALVLPLVALSGVSWEKFRQMLRDKYSNIAVLTIAGSGVQDIAFSADTGLGECLIVAHRGKERDTRAKFVSLRERPRSELDGLKIAHSICAIEDIRRLEDGPFGATAISVGEDEVGQILDYPMPLSGSWQLVGISDFSIAQVIFQLTKGKLWFPRWSTKSHNTIPMTTMRHLISAVPFHHSQIECWRWPDKTKVPSAPFEIHKPPTNAVPSYPTLWGQDAPRQRCMEVAPDSEAITLNSQDPLIRESIAAKAAKVWESATRIHHNRHFRYNSQALAVSSTEEASIGGNAWPSIIFPEENRRLWEDTYTVWGNSTLGVLCHWWQAGRQQSGRGNITVTALPALPTLDLRRLSAAQLAAAARIFDDHKQLPMLPINQIDEDPNRAELDRRLLTEVLGLPRELCANWPRSRASTAARRARWCCEGWLGCKFIWCIMKSMMRARGIA